MTATDATNTANTEIDAHTALANLYAGVPLLRGSLVASVDGRALIADLDESRQGSTAAVVASSFALGSKLAEVIGSSDVAEMTVTTDDGTVSLYSIGDRGVLAVMTMPGANLGLLHIRARQTTDALAPLMPDLIASKKP